MTISDIRDAMENRTKIIWSDHASSQLLKRGISRLDVFACIDNGEIIEDYPEDYPYPSCLVFGYGTLNGEVKKPIHVVIGFNGEYVWIIIAYVPNNIKFEDDLKTRR
ncbi:MAG: DUF4258 domain-containing protein [Lachnospiraceae bacterium]|nr:DUF4258 domain-containing protein [Lachnospiraceae bacterium]